MSDIFEEETGKALLKLRSFGPSLSVPGEGGSDFPEHEYQAVLKADNLPEFYQKLWIEYDRHRDYATTVIGGHVHFAGELRGITSVGESNASPTSDITAIRNIRGELKTEIDFERSVSVSSQELVDALSNGLQAAARLLELAPIESITYAATSWYGRGVFSTNLFAKYLDFWRSMETIAASLWVHEKESFATYSSTELKGLSEKKTKNLKKAFPKFEELSTLERSAWVLSKHGVDVEESDLKRMSDLRNKIAHGRATIRDLNAIHTDLPKLEQLARRVIGARVRVQYDIQIVSEIEFEGLSAYRLFMNEHYQPVRPSVRLSYTG